jgi:hypothetical protein
MTIETLDKSSSTQSAAQEAERFLDDDILQDVFDNESTFQTGEGETEGDANQDGSEADSGTEKPATADKTAQPAKREQSAHSDKEYTRKTQKRIDSLTFEREQMRRERDQAAAERDTAIKQRDEVAKQRDDALRAVKDREEQIQQYVTQFEAFMTADDPTAKMPTNFGNIFSQGTSGATGAAGAKKYLTAEEAAEVSRATWREENDKLQREAEQQRAMGENVNQVAKMWTPIIAKAKDEKNERFIDIFARFASDLNPANKASPEIVKAKISVLKVLGDMPYADKTLLAVWSKRSDFYALDPEERTKMLFKANAEIVAHATRGTKATSSEIPAGRGKGAAKNINAMSPEEYAQYLKQERKLKAKK